MILDEARLAEVTYSHTLDTPGNKEALILWHQVMTHTIQHKDIDLSSRQMALLLTVAMEEGQHTVRGLSEQLDISRPSTCRALNSLSKIGLIERVADTIDRRNVFVKPTKKGMEFLTSFSDTIMGCLVEM